MAHRPHPWGLLITFIELIKNPRYDFWTRPFVKIAPEIERCVSTQCPACVCVCVLYVYACAGRVCVSVFFDISFMCDCSLFESVARNCLTAENVSSAFGER